MSFRSFIMLLIWEAYLKALDDGRISSRVHGMNLFCSKALNEAYGARAED